MTTALSDVIVNPIGEDPWHLATLPLWDGGLGLRNPAAHAAVLTWSPSRPAPNPLELPVLISIRRAELVTPSSSLNSTFYN